MNPTMMDKDDILPLGYYDSDPYKPSIKKKSTIILTYFMVIVFSGRIESNSSYSP
jgi:hypothetical protein